MDIIGWVDEDVYVMGPVTDKNGNELRIGDTVHYKKDAREYEMDGHVRTSPARDEIFVIDGFIKSPFVKSRHHARGFEDPTWVTGSTLRTIRGNKNSVSPKALIKVDSPLVKKSKMDLTFVKPSKRLHVGSKPTLSIFQKIKELFG